MGEKPNLIFFPEKPFLSIFYWAKLSILLTNEIECRQGTQEFQLHQRAITSTIFSTLYISHQLKQLWLSTSSVANSQCALFIGIFLHPAIASLIAEITNSTMLTIVTGLWLNMVWFLVLQMCYIAAPKLVVWLDLEMIWSSNDCKSTAIHFSMVMEL